MTGDRTITAPLPADSEPAPAPSRTANGPRAGATVGRFIVLGPVGSGAMGVVSSAWDPELGRRVALKRLRIELGSAGDRSTWRGRLAAEARAMARLAHPNVVSVYDVLVVDDELYVAMELVEGEDLRAWARERRPDVRTIVEVMIGAGRGLAAAHERGLVHGDFKPDNVLVDGSGRAHVADFGLARALVHRPGSASDEPTVAGLVGTPAYMAPELLRGRPADPASDQFAFCTTLFELSYGVRPFAGREREERLAAIVDGHLATSGVAVPRRLRRILARGLAAHPEARWPSMTALLAELSHDPRRHRRLLVQVAGATLVCAATLTLVARRDRCAGGADRMARVWNADRRAEIEHAFASSGLASAAGVSHRAVTALDGYAVTWIAEHRDACEATHVRGEQSALRLEARMACLDRREADLDAVARVLATADAATIVGLEDMLGDLRPVNGCVPPVNLPRAVQLSDADAERAQAAARALADARALVPTRRLDEADAGIAAALAELAGIDHPALSAEIEMVRARVLRERARYDEARAAQTSARLAAEAAGADDVKLESELELVHIALEGNARPQDSRAAFVDAEATWMRLGREAGLESLLLRYEAAVLVEEDRRAEAIDALERAHALALVHAPERAPAILGRLALIRCDVGQRAQSIADVRAALAQAIELFGAEHPLVADLRYKLAGIHSVHEDWPAAEIELRAALVETRASWGPDHPRVAEILSRLAGAHAVRGELAEAFALHDEAFSIALPALGPAHPNVADLHTAHAGHLLQAGRARDALPEFERALAIYRATFGDRSLLTAKARANRALALAALGRTDEAESELVASIAVQERLLGREHAHVRNAIEALARLRSSG